MDIKILGSGCANCAKLQALCKEIIEENQWEATIEKITDMDRFADYGIMITPGLVINGEAVLQGKLPTKATLLDRLKKYA